MWIENAVSFMKNQWSLPWNPLRQEALYQEEENPLVWKTKRSPWGSKSGNDVCSVLSLLLPFSFHPPPAPRFATYIWLLWRNGLESCQKGWKGERESCSSQNIIQWVSNQRNGFQSNHCVSHWFSCLYSFFCQGFPSERDTGTWREDVVGVVMPIC